MTWNPSTYMNFGNERTRPAIELAARISVDTPRTVVDLGCGPGNSTAVLAQRWPNADIIGVDSSPEMLAKAQDSGVDADWIEADVAAWRPEAPVSVIYSNATLQWIDGHATMLPRLMAMVEPGGAFAIQMPRNFDAPSHVLLREVATNGPWAAKLAPFVRAKPVAEPEVYYAMLAPQSVRVDIWETEYLQVLDGDDPVFRWVSGTALVPIRDALEGTEREAFMTAYRGKLAAAYPKRSDGRTLFPFKRIFIVAMR